MGTFFSESDLETAKKELNNKSIVIVKNGRILFSSSEHGIKPLMRAIENYQLVDSSVADVIIGKAAAMLCVHAGVACIYGKIMSSTAADFLESRRISFDYGEIVEKILNKSKNDLCPFEKLVKDIEDENQAREKIRMFLSTL